MSKGFFAAVAVSLFLSGCTSTSLYSWGDYENNLYRYYHQTERKERVITDHLAFIAQLESRNIKPAPGLYAEAGTFLLVQGERDRAVEFYQKEHDAWPESQRLMSNLIKNLREQ